MRRRRLRSPPPHLADRSPESLWREYRKGMKGNLWSATDHEVRHGILTIMDAAELLEEIHGMGCALEINLDITAPIDAPIDPDHLAELRSSAQLQGETLRELLRVERDLVYTLAALEPAPLKP